MVAVAVESAPTSRPVGRPTKYTPDRIARLLELIAAGNKIITACKLAGIGQSTYNEWMLASEAGDPAFAGFAAEVHAAEGEAERALVSTIKDASSHDWKAAGWLLARRFGWLDESRVQHTHTGTVTTVHTLALPDPGAFAQLGGLLALPAVEGQYSALPPGDPPSPDGP